MRELAARIKSVLRRIENVHVESGQDNKEGHGKADIIFFGNWTMNCGKYEVSSDGGEPLSLTIGEFELLHALVSSPNRVLKREQLFEMTRGMDYDTYDRAIDIQIGRLRKKLNDDPQTPSLIKTVRGVGYMFIGDVKRAAAAA
jgi:two-component system OmpR family response regulator